MLHKAGSDIGADYPGAVLKFCDGQTLRKVLLLRSCGWLIGQKGAPGSRNPFALFIHGQHDIDLGPIYLR